MIRLRNFGNDPSPDCGIVKEILVKVGDSIKQGQVVAILEESTSEPAKEDPVEEAEAEIPETEPTETPDRNPRNRTDRNQTNRQARKIYC